MLLGTAAQRLVLGLDGALAMVPVAVWVAAAVAVVWGAHRRRLAPALLAGAALAWAGLVVVMAAQFGYAAIGRFYAPAAALLCVLAGVAVGGWRAVWAAGSRASRSIPRMRVRGRRPRRWRSRMPSRPLRTARAYTCGGRRGRPRRVVLAAAPSRRACNGCPPSSTPPRCAPSAEADLVAFVAAAGGRAGLLACGPLSVDATRPAGEVRPRLAWMLDLPMAGVRNSLDNGPGITVMRTGTLLDHTLALRPPDLARPLLRSRDWVAYAEYCPAGLAAGGKGRLSYSAPR